MGTVLLDTSVLVLLLRRHPPSGSETLLTTATHAMQAGLAVLPAIAVSELLAGERAKESSEGLRRDLDDLPTVEVLREMAADAGQMAGFLRSAGATIPLPDLLIAATAIGLELPLLTWDGDFPRALDLARHSPSTHPGAALLRQLRLHPASRPDASVREVDDASLPA